MNIKYLPLLIQCNVECRSIAFMKGVVRTHIIMRYLLKYVAICFVYYGLSLLSGEIRYQGKLLAEMSQREQAQEIGYVLQSPENQVVTDKVWHELAFVLESLGYDTPTVRRRVAEIAAFFGIEIRMLPNCPVVRSSY